MKARITDVLLKEGYSRSDMLPYNIKRILVFKEHDEDDIIVNDCESDKEEF